MQGSACFIVVAWLVLAADGGLIRQLISENLAGSPEQRNSVRYEFDPDVAERRRGDYEELHGVRGARLIERLGLGEDGYSRERRERQQSRDQRRLSVASPADTPQLSVASPANTGQLSSPRDQRQLSLPSLANTTQLSSPR